jgi:hypothetical protein
MTLADFARPIVLLALYAFPPLASAQTDAKAEARAHFDRGFALANRGVYAEAVTEFNRAYELSPHFAVLYNLGQAYSGLGHPVYATQALERYLNEGASNVPAQRRSEVKADIARLERSIAAVTLRSDIVGAVIQVDGTEVGRSPLPAAVRVNAGSHVFSAAAPGYRPWELRLVLPGQDQRVVEIRFEPVAVPVAVLPTYAPSTPAPVVQVAPTPTNSAVATPGAAPAGQSGNSAPPMASATPTSEAPSPATTAGATLVAVPVPATSGSRKTAAYVVGGAALGSLVVGGVFGLRAISKRHDSDGLCPNNQCSLQGVALNDQAKTAALVSDITVGAGLVSLAVATYLLVTSRAAAPTAGKLAYGIRVLPQIGPGEAGLSLMWGAAEGRHASPRGYATGSAKTTGELPSLPGDSR